MITAHLLHTLKKTIFTLIAVLLSAYVFVILLTYTANDPSWSRISSDMGQVSNMGGVTGAWLSDLLYTFFGWSAWWFIVFFAFEALSIWWQRRQAIGPFRVIGYTFLLLASSGFNAIIPQLLTLSNTTSARAGGILGSEIALRLTGLLTVYGASFFLFIFTLLTATFAFDIHWRRLLKEVFSLSWLGNGLKPEKINHLPAGDEQPTASDTEIEDELRVAQSEAADDMDIDSEHLQQSPLYQQLKLNLPEDASETTSAILDTDSFETETQTQPATSSRNLALSNVLDDFLVNSGLTESILSLREQQSQKSQPDAEHDGIHHDSEPAVSAKKQEPSFAWNDQQAMDELLDENSLPVQVADTSANHDVLTVEQHPQEVTDSASQQTMQQNSQLDTKQFDSTEDEQRTPFDETEHAYMKQAQVAMSTAATTAAVTSGIMSEDLAQQDDQQRVETSQQSEITENAATMASSDASDAMVDHSQQSTIVATDNVSQSGDDGYDANEMSTALDAQAQPVDLTPTNTPPANPKKPHEVVNQESSTARQETPSIRFATPEGDASNHIEDMVPDEYDSEQARLDKIMPEIHDDAAFAHSSRAMQTAKYRESLSPIPELSILDKPDPDRKPSYTQQELTQLSELLEIKLQEFNVKAEVVNAIPGPVVTRFEVELAAGVKASKVTGISRDLARSLSMASLRVVEVIPGKPYIGIEVPNKKREMVRLIELLDTEQYKDPKAQISMAMGKDIGGKPIITDLARAPHMLVAGTTGSGKSVLVNSMLLSMLLKYKPSELRLILIDPKQLELANYNDIPHLLTPVVTDMNEAASSLSWCVAEMERRYQLMSLLKVRKLNEFNKKVIAAEEAGKPMLDPLWRPNGSVSIDQAPKLKTLPMIVIVADEFADMIMQVGKQAEELITRLAQKSRAAGIHLMLATQRPSVDVITGLIKANIPVRAALRVNSKVDSRTILDAGGAEDMLGNGDMLFLGPGQIEPERVHGAYVSDAEVNRVCDAWRERGAPDYIDNMASNFELTSPSSSGGNSSGEDDALYDEAVAFVMETRKVSASSIQRKFSIGYNRAARIVDSMEEAGLVSAMGKSGKRELLM